MRRDITIKIRVTAEEREAIGDLAAGAGLAISAYMRSCALNAGGDQTDIRRLQAKLRAERDRLANLTVDPAVHQQIVRIGNNLNQIARAANTAQQNKALDVAAVAVQLSAIRQGLEEFRLTNGGR